MLQIILPCIIAFLVFWYYYKVCWSFWAKLGIQTHPNIKFPLGHFPNPFGDKFTNLGEVIQQQHYGYFKKQKLPFAGLYWLTTPIFIPLDLDFIKQITIKDFDHFDRRGLYYNEKDQRVSAHLFQFGGQRWKTLRVKLTPTFTSGKMKLMFPAVIQCTGPLMQELTLATTSNSGNSNCLADVKDLCIKFTTDVIGSCAFGIECNSFENSDFHKNALKVFNTTFFRAVKRSMMLSIPSVAKVLRLVPFPDDAAQFFERITMENVRMRKMGGAKRNDFIQLLMELFEKEVGGITEQELVAQAFLFFNAGMETSASTMAFTLYELSKNLDVQEKARNEINDVFDANGGQLSYQSLADLKYLHRVVDESLRLHPPVTVNNRECSRDYLIPGTNNYLPKSTKVFIPVKAIHHDPDYYPDPEMFDPDRFSEENVKARHSCAFMAFGDGPRFCIGARFAYMQVKVGLAYLLREYRVSTCSKTPNPMRYDPGFVLSSTVPIILNCQKI